MFVCVHAVIPAVCQRILLCCKPYMCPMMHGLDHWKANLKRVYSTGTLLQNIFLEIQPLFLVIVVLQNFLQKPNFAIWPRRCNTTHSTSHTCYDYVKRLGNHVV